MHNWRALLVLCLLLLPGAPARAQLRLDLEAGAAFNGYNDVRIPRGTGTPISLSEELSSDPAGFFRLRVEYAWSGATRLSLLAAPLRILASGSVPRAVSFDGVTFPARAPLRSRYRFDSYRLTYRFDFRRQGALQAGIGVTAKIRDAAIRLESDGLRAEKSNTGVVPLVNFRLLWRPAARFGMLLEGDALAAPQGRAEDVLAALQVEAGPRLALRLGYRVLEGGADVDEVYNFTLVHYASAGVALTF